jgi:hypothetical protein
MTKATLTLPNGNVETFRGSDAIQQAQQAYADHGFVGSIEVEQATSPDLTDPERGWNDAPTPDGITVTMTGEAGQNSPIARERQGRVNGALDAALNLATDGKVSEWAHTDPVYSAGDRVNALGVENFTREGNELIASGLLTDNARKAADVIDAEDRRPVAFNLRDLRLDVVDGSLVMRRTNHPGKAGLPVTPDVLADICEYYPATFGAIKPSLVTDYQFGGLSPDNKAETFNRYVVDRWKTLEGNAAPNRRQRRGPSVRKGDLLLWVRKQSDAWQAFTVTSPKNTSKGFDGAAFLRTVADVLEGSGFYGQVDYTPANTRVAFAGWMMPNHIIDLAAGDVFKAGISGGTSDSKKGGYALYLSAIRNLCLNLIIIAHEQARLLKKTHIAKPGDVQRATRNALTAADGALDSLRDEWKILRTGTLADPEEDLNMEAAAIDKASKLFPGTPVAVAVALQEAAKIVTLSGVKRDVLLEGLLTGWKAEPGETPADIVNAVSRLHLLREIDEYQLAREAGALVPILAKRQS